MRNPFALSCAATSVGLQRAVEGTLDPADRHRLREHLAVCKRCRREAESQAGSDRALRALATEAMGPGGATVDCAPEGILAGFADDTLPVHLRRQWLDHVTDCLDCASAVGAVRQALRDAPPMPSRLTQLLDALPEPSTPMRAPHRGWAPALGLCVAAAIGVILLRDRLPTGEPGRAPTAPPPPLVADAPPRVDLSPPAQEPVADKPRGEAPTPGSRTGPAPTPPPEPGVKARAPSVQAATRSGARSVGPPEQTATPANKPDPSPEGRQRRSWPVYGFASNRALDFPGRKELVEDIGPGVPPPATAANPLSPPNEEGLLSVDVVALLERSRELLGARASTWPEGSPQAVGPPHHDDQQPGRQP